VKWNVSLRFRGRIIFGLSIAINTLTANLSKKLKINCCINIQNITMFLWMPIVFYLFIK